MKATKETQQRMILAVTGLMTPVACWLVFGFYERLAPKPEPTESSFFEREELSPERRSQIQLLRSNVLESAKQGDWPLVRKLADEGCGINCPPLIFPLQAEAYWRMGEREKSAKLWSRALPQETAVGEADYLALKGDTDAYKTHVLSVLSKAPKENPSLANDVAWACVLLPDILPDYSPVVALGEEAVQGAESPEARTNALNTLGVVLYRAGRFEEALAKLTESETLAPEMMNVVFMALCHHKLGHAEPARHEANRYYQFLDSSLPTNHRSRHEYVLFEQELRAVLPPEPRAKPQPTPKKAMPFQTTAHPLQKATAQ